MPRYFSKHFDLQHVGDRLVQVHCDKCRCPYFYELARIGSGSATAPYGVGTTSAARSAEKQSQRDLRERLAIRLNDQTTVSPVYSSSLPAIWSMILS